MLTDNISQTCTRCTIEKKNSSTGSKMKFKLFVVAVWIICAEYAMAAPFLTTTKPVTTPGNASYSSQCSQKPQPSFTPQCHRYYSHGGGTCNSSIPVNAWVFVDKKQQTEYEKRMRTVRIKRNHFGSMQMPNPAVLQKNKCFRIIHDMYCHYYFPRCDVTSNITRPQSICREACEMLNFMCKREWITLIQNYPGVTWSAQDDIGEKVDEHEPFSTYITKNILMKCDGLPRMNGPDVPECFIAPELLYDKTMLELVNGSSYDCFYGNGFAYRGNTSVTSTGHQCQAWSAQCPHRHFRTPDKYPELAGAGSACRNPGHQAPHGPWCYTSNPDVRWEYCNVTRCSYDKSLDFVISLNQIHSQHQGQGNSTNTAQRLRGSKSQG